MPEKQCKLNKRNMGKSHCFPAIIAANNIGEEKGKYHEPGNFYVVYGELWPEERDARRWGAAGRSERNKNWNKSIFPGLVVVVVVVLLFPLTLNALKIASLWLRSEWHRVFCLKHSLRGCVCVCIRGALWMAQRSEGSRRSTADTDASVPLCLLKSPSNI